MGIRLHAIPNKNQTDKTTQVVDLARIDKRGRVEVYAAVHIDMFFDADDDDSDDDAYHRLYDGKAIVLELTPVAETEKAKPDGN